MATITPYKIATRTWAHNTMGSAAKFSYSTGNDCLIASDINQDSSSFIITPSSNTNGAIPSSSLPDNTKCIKQSDLDNMYSKSYVNVDAKITYNKNALLFDGKYNLSIRVYYKNFITSNNITTYPVSTGILKNLDIDVIINCYNKNGDIEPVAKTTTGCSLLANAFSTKEIGMVCLSINNAPTLISDTITGLIDNEVFAAHYLEDMYNYYNGGTSTYRYDIISSISPEYGVEYSTVFQPQKYVPMATNVVTTTSTSVITASIQYDCTSNSNATLVPGVSTTWGYRIIVSNITPTTSTTPASSISVTVDKGTITRNNSWNSTTKTLTITGSVTYTSTSELELVPIVKISYKKSGYTPLSAQFVVNLTQSVVA